MKGEYIARLFNNFNNARNSTHTTHEHIQTFYNYTRECNSVCEVGIEGGFSTWGFLMGLFDNKTKFENEPHLFYIGVDINEYPVIEDCKDICKNINLDFTFIHQNSIFANIPQVDLLYIDSWHVYGHLKRELEHLHSKANKYIIMHDTSIDAEDGESIRRGWDTAKQAEESGYPEEEIRKGLWPAILEFLDNHPEWILKERFTNCYGLTILERV
jgi:hypothetical protein